MEGRSPHIEDLRNSIRHNINRIPINIISKNAYIPARLNNVSSAGLQILCSNYAAQQLSKSKYSPDGPINVVAEILDKDDLITFELRCDVVYINKNHSPTDYCSDSVGLVLIDNLEDRRLLSHFTERNT